MLTFELRTRIFGRVRLRRQLPRPVSGERFERERDFYNLLLTRARADFAATAFDGVDEVYDIGCRNWSYAPVLAEAFPNARLLGVEVDGGRRYWNLHRRIDAAASQARELAQAGFEAAVIHNDFRQLRLDQSTAASALFCFFYPFVSEHPCRKWGLPTRFSDFHALVVHAGTSSARRCQVLSVHQGEWEAEIARRDYERAGLSFRETVIQPSLFKGLWPNEYPMHVFLVADARLR